MLLGMHSPLVALLVLSTGRFVFLGQFRTPWTDAARLQAGLSQQQEVLKIKK